MIVAILAVMAMLAGIAFGDPGHWIWWTVGFSFALGIAGATLDLVLDGWRITSVRPPEKQAVLSSWTEIGWRVLDLRSLSLSISPPSGYSDRPRPDSAPAVHAFYWMAATPLARTQTRISESLRNAVRNTHPKKALV